jgi:hypothetical protein
MATPCRHQVVPTFVASAIIAALYALSSDQRTLAAQSTPAEIGISLTGCLLTESEYAAAHGLARDATPGSGSSQLILVVGEGATSRIEEQSARVDAYALTGRREAELVPDVGRRMELLGDLEPALGRRAPDPDADADDTFTPTGAVGVTEGGSPAHEPTDATVTGPRAVPAGIVVQGRIAAVADLARINVSGARHVDGVCARPVPVAAGEATQVVSSTETAQSSGVMPALNVTSDPNVFDITLNGCVVRRDDSAAEVRTYLALVRARRVDRTRSAGSAVPGSLPSGDGSGTVGVVATSGYGDSGAYRLSGSESALGPYVGRRVEIVGAIDRVGGAHPSAPEQRVAVKSFTPVAGSCRD